MEVYALDSLWRRVAVVDKFESLIWTERFKDKGDCHLTLASTPAARSLFTNGTHLAINNSHRVMVVDEALDTMDSDGKRLLSVKGTSIERILDDRVARGVMAGTTATPKWALTGTAGAIMRQIFHDICVTGVLDVADIIPSVIEDNVLFPDDTVPEPSTTLNVELEPTTVFEALKNLADLYDLGFRLVRNYDSGQLYFDVYAGSDRTTLNGVLPPVVFSPALDSLQNTSSLTTTADAKNCAYVFSPVGSRVVYPIGTDPSVSGFDRRVLLVNASDITDPTPAVANALMDQRGLEELSKHRSLSAFDGEIDQRSPYKYGTHYHLGDLVTLQNDDGVSTNMRVIEQIFVHDAEGERAYPTLALNLYINPGSWLAWDFNDKWVDMGLTDYWSTAG